MKQPLPIAMPPMHMSMPFLIARDVLEASVIVGVLIAIGLSLLGCGLCAIALRRV